MRFRAILAAVLALCLGVLSACADEPTGYVDKSQLTYDDILGTGLANVCPQLAPTNRGTLSVQPEQTFKVKDMCIQPKEFFVKEEPVNQRREAEFVPGKLLTRSTSSLDQISGTLSIDPEGKLVFTELDGIDFQPITVQLPGGEQVPFLFTVKGLVASSSAAVEVINTSVDLKGDYNVPSYRGAVFLDPKGRGVASGYDNAVALPSQADEEDYLRANVKQVETGTGEIVLQVQRIDSETQEIAGTFECDQPSDTDLGAKDPEDVKIRGVFYARLEA